MADSDNSYRMDIDNPSTAAQTVGYTFCDGCNQSPFCGIKFYKTGNIVSHIESWPGFPAAPLCSKAYGTLQRLYHPHRLKYPLKRVNPKGAQTADFVRISWEAAYDIIVSQLNRIQNEYGPHAAFFYVGDPKEPRAAVQRLAATYGSVNYGTESSTACRRAAMLAELLTYGFPTVGNLPTRKTGVVLIWGTNPAYSGRPFMCHGQLADAKADGVKFIVVDPRKTPTAVTLADIHLRPRPATTAALAAGMMHVIFKESLHDRGFCENWIYGIDELQNYVRDFTPGRVEKITEPLERMAPWFDGPPEFSMREKFNEMKTERLDRKAFPAWAEKFWANHYRCWPLKEPIRRFVTAAVTIC